MNWMERAHTLEHWLDQALDAKTPDERDGVLAALADQEPGLLAPIHAMLRADSQALAIDALRPSTPEAGDTLGPWTLREVLGQGGMGTVYLAQREVAGDVQQGALKILSAGRTSPRARQRFLREHRLLMRASDHPFIARFLDAGVADDGTLFVVTQYVCGAPLLEAADADALDVVRRVRLLRDVSRAVAFLHQRAVVHRDLKPSNVLVAAGPTPKLLDFGISRALTEEDALTLSHEQLLTPAWAAPEQLLGHEITTATDVYALGLMLCALLTGDTPFEADHLMGMIQARRDVSLSFSTPVSPGVAAMRGGLSPKALSSAITGDLEAIVNRCLRFESDARYPSAEALSEDLDRYLVGEAIEARRGQAWYVVSRWVRRRRAPLLIVGLLLGFGITYTVTLARQARELRQERDRVQVESRKAKAMSEFLTEILVESNPEAGGSSEPTLRAALGRAAQRLQHDLQDQPVARASLYRVLGSSYSYLEASKEADEMFARAQVIGLPTSHPEHIHLLIARGMHLAHQGHGQRARVILDRAIALASDPSPELADALVGSVESVLWSTSYDATHIARLERALVILELLHGPNDVRLAKALSGLSIMCGAEELLCGPDSRERAAALMTRALKISRMHYGPRHPQVAEALQRMAYVSLEGAAARSKYLTDALEIGRETMQGHYRLHQMVNDVALDLERHGDRAGAIVMMDEALEIARSMHAESHVSVARYRRNRASMLREQGKLEEAAAELEALYAQHHSAYDMSNLAMTRTLQGRYEDAMRLHREILETLPSLEKKPHSYKRAVTRRRLAHNHWLRGDVAAAADEITRATSILVEPHQYPGFVVDMARYQVTRSGDAAREALPRTEPK